MYAERGDESCGEADAEALRGAINVRQDFVSKGATQAERASRARAMRGVSWDSSRKSWRVKLVDAAGKQWNGGYFRPKDDTAEEMERARLAALESRKNLMLKCGLPVEG